jgi:hypothetical protein
VQVASATEAVGTSFRKLGASLSNLTGRVSKRSTDTEPRAYLPADVPDIDADYTPPVQPPQAVNASRGEETFTLGDDDTPTAPK